jgi:hypothetical protein
MADSKTDSMATEQAREINLHLILITHHVNTYNKSQGNSPECSRTKIARAAIEACDANNHTRALINSIFVKWCDLSQTCDWIAKQHSESLNPS